MVQVAPSPLLTPTIPTGIAASSRQAAGFARLLSGATPANDRSPAAAPPPAPPASGDRPPIADDGNGLPPSTDYAPVAELQGRAAETETAGTDHHSADTSPATPVLAVDSDAVTPLLAAIGPGTRRADTAQPTTDQPEPEQREQVSLVAGLFVLPIIAPVTPPPPPPGTASRVAGPDEASPPVAIPRPALPGQQPAQTQPRIINIPLAGDAIDRIALADPRLGQPVSLPGQAQLQPPSPTVVITRPAEPPVREAPATPPVATAPTATPEPVLIGVAQPAVRAFATAIAAAARSANRPVTLHEPLDEPGVTTPGAITADPSIRTSALDAPTSTVDIRRADWTARLVDHIEALRDAANARDTRITLVPHALGKIDVAVRQDGDTLHVHFAAEAPATRVLIADAQPRLAEIAESRGLRLGQSSVDGGTNQHQPQRQGTAPDRSAPPPAAGRARESADDDGTRLSIHRIA